MSTFDAARASSIQPKLYVFLGQARLSSGFLGRIWSLFGTGVTPKTIDKIKDLENKVIAMIAKTWRDNDVRTIEGILQFFGSHTATAPKGEIATFVLRVKKALEERLLNPTTVPTDLKMKMISFYDDLARLPNMNYDPLRLSKELRALNDRFGELGNKKEPREEISQADRAHAKVLQSALLHCPQELMMTFDPDTTWYSTALPEDQKTVVEKAFRDTYQRRSMRIEDWSTKMAPGELTTTEGFQERKAEIDSHIEKLVAATFPQISPEDALLGMAELEKASVNESFGKPSRTFGAIATGVLSHFTDDDSVFEQVRDETSDIIVRAESGKVVFERRNTYKCTLEDRKLDVYVETCRTTLTKSPDGTWKIENTVSFKQEENSLIHSIMRQYMQVETAKGLAITPMAREAVAERKTEIAIKMKEVLHPIFVRRAESGIGVSPPTGVYPDLSLAMQFSNSQEPGATARKYLEAIRDSRAEFRMDSEPTSPEIEPNLLAAEEKIARDTVGRAAKRIRRQDGTVDTYKSDDDTFQSNLVARIESKFTLKSAASQAYACRLMSGVRIESFPPDVLSPPSVSAQLKGPAGDKPFSMNIQTDTTLQNPMEVTETDTGFIMENKQFFFYTESPPQNPVTTAVFCYNLRSELYKTEKGEMMWKHSAIWTPIDK